MAITPEHQKTAKTWQTMVDNNKALLLRKTGHDAAYCAEQARTAGLKNDAGLRHWMRATSTASRVMRSTPSRGSCSLHSPRRKFAQVTRTTNTAVDVALRLDAAAGGRLEALKARADDPFGRRVRLTTVDQVDEELLEILARALDQNS